MIFMMLLRITSYSVILFIMGHFQWSLDAFIDEYICACYIVIETRLDTRRAISSWLRIG